MAYRYVDQFSTSFHCWIQQGICNEPLIVIRTIPIYVVTLPCETNTFAIFRLQLLQRHIEIHYFSVNVVIHIIWHVLPQHASDSTSILPVVCEICCEFFIFQQNNRPTFDRPISSLSVHSLCHAVCVSHFSILKMETSTFISSGLSVAPIPRSESSELQHFLRNAAVGLPEKSLTWTDPHYRLVGMALTYALSVTQRMSGVTVNVSKYAFTSKDDFMSIYFYCRYTHV